MKYGKVVMVLLLSLAILLCASCSSDKPSESTAWDREAELAKYEGKYLLEVRVLRCDTDYIRYYGDLGAGNSGQCDETFVAELEQLLQSGAVELIPTEFPGCALGYEVIAIIPAIPYFSEMWNQESGDTARVEAVISLAYSYADGNVYLFWKDGVYLVPNPDVLREKLGTQASMTGAGFTDKKIFWYEENSTIPPEIAGRDDIDCNFQFRYDRYWGLDREPLADDFFELASYHAANAREMIDHSAASLGISNIKAYLANDVYSGAWRVEMYGMNTDGQSIEALLYFDREYRLIWGCLE